MKKSLLLSLCLSSILFASNSSDLLEEKVHQFATNLQSYLPYKIDELTIVHSAISNKNIITIAKSIDMVTFATRVLKKKYEDISDKEKQEVFEYVKKSFAEGDFDTISACSDMQSKVLIDEGAIMLYRYFAQSSHKLIVEIMVDKESCKELDKKPLF